MFTSRHRRRRNWNSKNDGRKHTIRCKFEPLLIIYFYPTLLHPVLLPNPTSTQAILHISYKVTNVLLLPDPTTASTSNPLTSHRKFSVANARLKQSPFHLSLLSTLNFSLPCTNITYIHQSQKLFHLSANLRTNAVLSTITHK